MTVPHLDDSSGLPIIDHERGLPGKPFRSSSELRCRGGGPDSGSMAPWSSAPTGPVAPTALPAATGVRYRPISSAGSIPR